MPAHYLEGLLALARRPREELVQLLKTHQLPESLLTPGSTLQGVSVLAAGRLFTDLVRRSQEDIHSTAQNVESILSLSSYRLLYTYMLTGKTLEEALQKGRQFYTRFHHGQQIKLEREGDHYRVILQFDDQKATDILSLEQFSFSQLLSLPGRFGRISNLYIWHRFASWLIGNFIDLLAVHVDLPPSRNWSEGNNFFGCTMYFNADCCALEFSAHYLERRVSRSNADLEKMLANFPDDLVTVDFLRDSTVSRVRCALFESTRSSLPGLEQVAEDLHMTCATLHRRLAEEGTSFQQEKDHFRRQRAVALLRENQQPAANIAEQLGFSDVSTFSRAFKRWTGVTPSAFRQQQHCD